jgi:acyl-CoA hydrolase
MTSPVSGARDESLRAALRAHLRRGSLVAVGDGAGAPVSLLPALVEVAEEVGGLRVLCGWCLGDEWEVLDHPSIELMTYMGGYAMRSMLSRGAGTYLPLRLGSVPAVLATALRPDLVMVSGRMGGQRWSPGTEVSWMPAAIESGAAVVVAMSDRHPAGSWSMEIPAAQLAAVVMHDDRPAETTEPAIDEVSERIGRLVAALIPAGAAVQYGPGAIGRAVLGSISAPVRLRSGVITDAAVDLDRRGLLLPGTVAAYALGSPRLYEWLGSGAVALERVEVTHDVTALAAAGVHAVNTALEIDGFGQVNVERVGDDVIAGVGGHADFALAGARSPSGLSILALPSRRSGRSTLDVERLSGPVSTSRSDIDIVVNEWGSVDLRPLGDAARRRELLELWRLPPD